MSLLLMYYLSDEGDRVYTLKVSKQLAELASSLLISVPRYQDLDSRNYHIQIRPEVIYYSNAAKKTDPEGKPTISAHPARFSPEDKYSRQRIITKRRFGLLPTQQPKSVV